MVVFESWEHVSLWVGLAVVAESVQLVTPSHWQQWWEEAPRQHHGDNIVR